MRAYSHWISSRTEDEILEINNSLAAVGVTPSRPEITFLEDYDVVTVSISLIPEDCPHDILQKIGRALLKLVPQAVITVTHDRGVLEPFRANHKPRESVAA